MHIQFRIFEIFIALVFNYSGGCKSNQTRSVGQRRHKPSPMFRLACALLLLLLTYQYISQATYAPFILPRDESSCNCIDGCSKRTLFNIIWGCVSTTIICAWAAIHPNIPPREGPFKATLRRFELMFWTIVAPEILPAWALNQRLAAMTVRVSETCTIKRKVCLAYLFQRICS